MYNLATNWSLYFAVDYCFFAKFFFVRSSFGVLPFFLHLFFLLYVRLRAFFWWWQPTEDSIINIVDIKFSCTVNSSVVNSVKIMYFVLLCTVQLLFCLKEKARVLSMDRTVCVRFFFLLLLFFVGKAESTRSFYLFSYCNQTKGIPKTKPTSTVPNS